MAPDKRRKGAKPAVKSSSIVKSTPKGINGPRQATEEKGQANHEGQANREVKTRGPYEKLELLCPSLEELIFIVGLDRFGRLGSLDYTIDDVYDITKRRWPWEGREMDDMEKKIKAAKANGFLTKVEMSFLRIEKPRDERRNYW